MSIAGNELEALEELAQIAADEGNFLAIGRNAEGYFIRYRREHQVSPPMPLDEAIDEATIRALADKYVNPRRKHRLRQLRL